MEDSVANGEDKVQTKISSSPGLQVSVSFGRFENDSLSWERFSAFSPNMYLEEVEKYATPGSVAQKKAYFEAHYKKIAERKDELMDQEKQMEKASIRPSVQYQGGLGGETVGSLSECDVNGVSNGQYSDEEDKLVTDIAIEVRKSCVHENSEESEVVKEIQTSIDEVKEERRDVSAKLEKLEEVVLQEVKEEIPSKDTDNATETTMKEMKKERDNNNRKKTKEGDVKMNHARGSPKSNPVNKKPAVTKTVTNRKTPPSKERSMATATKRPASPVPKASKQASTSTSMSTSRTSTKKENASTSSRHKQAAPKSLHMSLTLGPSASDPTALTVTRKSLIMERMGDKDIVMRAFKTFQKSFDPSKSSTDEQSTIRKQVPAKATSVSALTTITKENGRPSKTGIIEKKSSGAYRSSSSGLMKSYEKHKEVSKILREKSGARAVERTRLQAKPKVGSTDVKTRRHSLDLKAKPVQGTLSVPALSKGSSDKDLKTDKARFCLISRTAP